MGQPPEILTFIRELRAAWERCPLGAGDKAGAMLATLRNTLRRSEDAQARYVADKLDQFVNDLEVPS